MEIHELVQEMNVLERQMSLYEEKYGVLSEEFYHALMAGHLGKFDEYDETRWDFLRWQGLYKTWEHRKREYMDIIRGREIATLLRFQPAY